MNYCTSFETAQVGQSVVVRFGDSHEFCPITKATKARLTVEVDGRQMEFSRKTGTQVDAQRFYKRHLIPASPDVVKNLGDKHLREDAMVLIGGIQFDKLTTAEILCIARTVPKHGVRESLWTRANTPV